MFTPLLKSQRNNSRGAKICISNFIFTPCGETYHIYTTFERSSKMFKMFILACSDHIRALIKEQIENPDGEKVDKYHNKTGNIWLYINITTQNIASISVVDPYSFELDSDRGGKRILIRLWILPRPEIELFVLIFSKKNIILN